MEILFIISGLIVGFLVGLTGIGAGSLMTPILVFLFGISPALAVGTVLLFSAITKIGGVWIHHARNHSIEWRLVKHLSIGSIPGSLAVIVLLENYRSHIEEMNRLINTTVGLTLILTAIALFFAEKLMKSDRPFFIPENVDIAFWQKILTIINGFILGSLVTLSSIGAGSLGMAALLIVYPRMPPLKIIGTDIAHAFPLTVVATLGHLHLGNIDFLLMSWLLLGSVPGIILGSRLSARIPDKLLRPAMGMLLLLIGIRFLI